MSAGQRFSLKWNNYLTHITTAFDNLREEDDFIDCTLSCEGKKIKAHKMLLSACSSYFREIFKENPCPHPVIILKGVSSSDLESLVDFMYNGEVNVLQEQLGTFLNTAELLQVKGLTDGAKGGGQLPNSLLDPPDLSNQSSRSPPLPNLIPFTQTISTPRSKSNNTPPTKRKRLNHPPPQIDYNSPDQSRSPKSVDSSERVDVVPIIDPVDIPMKFEDNSDFVDENDDVAFVDEENYEENSGSGDGAGPSGGMHSSGEGTSQDPVHGPRSGDGSSHSRGATVNQYLQMPNVKPRFSKRNESYQLVNGRYHCLECGKSYSHQSEIYKHFAVHEGRTKCEICQRVFTTKQTLRKHNLLLHGVKINY